MPKIVEILDFLKQENIPFTFRGNAEDAVERFSSLSHYQPGTFTWVKKQENVPAGFDCTAVALAIVSEGVTGAFPNVIETPQSKYAFFSAMEHFYAEDEKRPAVGQFTYLSPKVKLGRNVRIGHNCTLDGDITIGDNTVIWNNVTIVNRVTIGADCEIQSGTVIGHDGFGYTEDENHVKTMVKHFGGVTIGDGVLISSNCCVCRGTIDDTRIGAGAKLDTLCHIAHNVQLGRSVSLVSGTVLYGSSVIGENAYIASGLVRNQCCVGENSIIGMGAVAVKDVAPGQTVIGNPAKPYVKEKKG